VPIGTDALRPGNALSSIAMNRVLLVVPTLEYSGTSKQLVLLAAGLPGCGFEVGVAVLGDSGPHAKALRARGITVYSLGWRRLIDLGLFGRLRRIVDEFRPEVIHSWHPLSLRVLATAGADTTSRLIACAPMQQLPSRSSGYPWDRWLLGRADRVVATGAAQVEHYRRQRIPATKTIEVPPGVAACTRTGERLPLCRRLGIDPDARLIFCAGPLLPEKGFQDAIWTFAILRYLFEDLHLIFIGGGPDQLRLQQFVRTSGLQSHVHFLGYQPDAAALLGLGEVVWVPSRRFGGVNVALEGMAAGRPVVASRLPALVEVIRDGETGFLIDPGDKIALARRTRKLLDDPKRCHEMGEAGKQRIEKHFAAARFVERWAQLYEEVTHGPKG